MSQDAATLGRVLDALIARFADHSDDDELTRAKKEYSERRGRVFEDDEQWESFTRGFLEWMVVERRFRERPLSPAMLAASEAEDEDRDALLAWGRSQRCLCTIEKVEKDGVFVHDMVGDADFFVYEERNLVGMQVQDVVELRLVGYRGRVHLGRTFVYHPAETVEAIRKLVDDMRRQGAPRADIIDHMALLRSRSRSYRHVPAIRIYESNGEVRRD